jgi:hypothetical protein
LPDHRPGALSAVRNELSQIAAGEHVDEVGNLEVQRNRQLNDIVRVGTFKPRSIWR